MLAVQTNIIHTQWAGVYSDLSQNWTKHQGHCVNIGYNQSNGGTLYRTFAYKISR